MEEFYNFQIKQDEFNIFPKKYVQISRRLSTNLN